MCESGSEGVEHEAENLGGAAIATNIVEGLKIRLENKKD
jgi:hypothetical protein